MSRVVYLNGAYISQSHALISIDDRGFQFADSVYEVIALVKGKWIDLDLHLTRLYRSCQEIQLSFPYSLAVLNSIIAELCRRNRLQNGLLYIQVTRGVASRAHVFPFKTNPSLLMTLKPFQFERSQDPMDFVSIITHPENRWTRPDIKSTALLANVLAKQKAHTEGAYEAVYVTPKGWITEGSHSNVWIVNDQGHLQTHPADHCILNGITRQRLLKIALAHGIVISERPFTLAEMKRASAVFLTGTTTLIKAVERIDQEPVKSTSSNSVAFLRKKYLNYCGL